MNDAVQKSSGADSISNVRLVPLLPVRFISEEYDRQFLLIVAQLMRNFLLDASTRSDSDYQTRVDYFKKFGLLELSVPRFADFGPLEIVVPGQDKKITSPAMTVPYGFERVTWSIDRHRFGDGDYLTELCFLMAYFFAIKILPDSTKYEQLVLLRLDDHTFQSFLKNCHRGQLKPDVLAQMVGLSHVMPLTEGLEGFKVFDQLKPRLAMMVEQETSQFEEGLDLRLDSMVSDYKKKVGLN